MDLKATAQLWILGLTRIPMILFCRPRIIRLDEDASVIRIPLKRRTKNHLGSFYLGAFSVGADLSAGLLAYHISRKRKIKTSIVFKSLHARFLRRAMSHVDFICTQGPDVLEMIRTSQIDGSRQNRMLLVQAICEAQLVAEISIELSIKTDQAGN